MGADRVIFGSDGPTSGCRSPRLPVELKNLDAQIKQVMLDNVTFEHAATLLIAGRVVGPASNDVNDH